MVGSNTSSGLGLNALCETLESRNLFSSDVGLDKAFRGGIVDTGFGGDDEAASQVIALKDGRALAAGYSHGGTFGDVDRFVLAAYNKDGTLSNRFDGDGKLVLPESLSDRLGFFQLVQANDGGVLLLGQSAILKLRLNGAIDTSFGKNGLASRLATDSPDLTRDFIQLADGTLRDATYQDGLLRIQEENAAGKTTKSIRRTIGVGFASVDVDTTGVYVVASSKKVYRFNATDLSKTSGFGKGGVVDLDPYFQSWASEHGPWTDQYGDDPLPGNPDYYVYSTADAKSGLVVVGSTYSVSVNAHEVYPPGLGGPYTPLSFSVTNNGKSVAVDSGYVNGKLLAHTAYQPYPGTGEDGFDFGGTFTKTNGDVRYFSASRPGDAQSQTGGAAELDDGSFYVVGQNIHEYPGGVYKAQFQIVKTVVV